MEDLVLKIKSLSHWALIILVVAMAATLPLKGHAQDDMSSGSDEETIIPPNTGNNAPPPTIIDESDSGGVSDVEEYDG